MVSGDIVNRRVKPKVYAIDTNVLYLSPYASNILSGNLPSEEEVARRVEEVFKKSGKIWDGKPNDVLIPAIVRREVDRKLHDPKSDPDVLFLARRARDALHDLVTENKVKVIRNGDSGDFGTVDAQIRLQNGAIVYFNEHNEKDFMQKGIPEPNNDDRILYQVERFAEKHKNKRVILVSADKALRTEAIRRGIETQDFEFENVQTRQLYSGISLHPESDDLEKRLNQSKAHDFTSEELKATIGILPKPNQVIAFYEGLPENIKSYFIAKQTKEGSYTLKPISAPKIARDLIKAHNERLGPSLSLEQQLLADPSLQDTVNTVLKTKLDELKILRERSIKGSKKKKQRSIIEIGRHYDNLVQRISELDTSDLSRVFDLAKKIDMFYAPVAVKVTPQITSQPIKIKYVMNDVIQPVFRQNPYFELLFDNAVKILSVNGSAGTGKTYFAMLAGLVQCMQGKYKDIKYMRPNVLADDGHGFLGGKLDEKLDPLNQPAIRSLETIFKYSTLSMKLQAELREFIHGLSGNLINFVALSYQGGNTWDDSFIIADETQFTDHELARMIVGRVGSNSKLTFMGDFSQFAQKGRKYNYLNRRNCGLAHVIDKFTGEPIYAHIEFTKAEIKRSEVAALASKL